MPPTRAGDEEMSPVSMDDEELAYHLGKEEEGEEGEFFRNLFDTMVILDPETHVYHLYAGVRKKAVALESSVTGRIKDDLVPPFDAAKAAARTAARQAGGTTADDVLRQWDENSKRGTSTHETLEALALSLIGAEDPNALIQAALAGGCGGDKCAQQGTAFLLSMYAKGYVVLAAEAVLAHMPHPGEPKDMLAGTADLLMAHAKTEEVALVDWKTTMKPASAREWPREAGAPGPAFPCIPDTKPAKWGAQLALLAEMVARAPPGNLLHKGRPLNVTSLVAVELCRGDERGPLEFREWPFDRADFRPAVTHILSTRAKRKR